MKSFDKVLTSDLFHYWVGQGVLWLAIAVCVVLVFRRGGAWPVRLAFAAALAFAFVSSLMPLFVRWAAFDVGGPDAAAEETILSFFGTLPQTIMFSLLMWLALRNGKAAPENVLSGANAA